MTGIKKLDTRVSKSSIAAAEVLEDAFYEAKNGEILSVGICMVMTGNRVSWRVGGGHDTAALLGAAVKLQDKLARQISADDED